MVNTRHVVLASILAAHAVFGGILTAPLKIAAKIAGHSADNVAAHVATHSADNVVGHVVTHNADDAAKLAAKGGAKVAATAPKVVKAVDAAVDAARLEAAASKPAVASIHRPPIPKPRHPAIEAAIRETPKIAVGVGLAAGAAIASDNLTAGERDLDRATGEAIRKDPALARVRIEESGRWKGVLGGCVGAAAILVALALAFKIARPSLTERPPRHGGENEQATASFNS